MPGVGAHHPRPVGLRQLVSVRTHYPQLYVAWDLSRTIDVKHLGRERVIAAHELDGVIVDPGPASSVETLLEALGDEVPRALLLTHIHLDHAGATGVLVRRFPDLQVHVHERGAPHLVDPGKLIASASRLYGDEMERLWGEIAPVPAENVHALAGGETVEGYRVAATPGHANHHVAYLHEESGEAFVGDMAGVRIPPSEYTLAPTVPPEFDLDAWLASLETIEGWQPRAIYLTHFGREDDPPAQFARVRDWLERFATHPEGDQDAWYARLADGDRRSDGRRNCGGLQARLAAEHALPGTRALLVEGGAPVSTETIERPRTQGPGDGLGGAWRVIVLNDNHNTFDGVASALARTIPGISLDKGYAIADQIHTSGQAIVWTGQKEPAEHYWEQLKEAGLTMAPLEQG